MHSIDEIKQRTEQVKRLTDAIRRWNSMTQKYQELRERINQIQDEREALRIQMAEHHSMLDALQKELRPSGPEIVWHEILYGQKP
ncbi:hypothetical protein ABI36_0232000 [Pseudomonas aeruginosa]|nr:hypothetical protein ABI36_0232000 [Pseudomonas aeruginosa]